MTQISTTLLDEHALAAATADDPLRRDQMNIVTVGHVDHGKSTVIGRLLADTGSLPDGKLEQVKEMCRRNARPFEYAFLLDALKNEQAQGITIDTARCFFKTDKRNYILNDAPGHIEFLKNMVTGAARAEAALLIIDAAEGIQENSKRHGYMISMLGVPQFSVLVNKMDLVGFSEATFRKIVDEYTAFLNRLGANPVSFIPIAAREGINITTRSTTETAWYNGPTVLEQIDAFEKPRGNAALPFRMPVQDIYKFTAHNDDRRIVVGTIDAGMIRVGDEVTFLPSRKKSAIKSVEGFNVADRDEAFAGQAAGFQLATQIYIKPGELMVKAGDVLPEIGRRFRANVFWMGRAPLVKDKDYKLKLGSARVAVRLAEIRNVLDASELSSIAGKQQIDRHDVGEVVFETVRPIAFDLRKQIEPTGRFVIVDDFEIAGAGIVLEALAEIDSLARERLRQREFAWEKGSVTPAARAEKNGHTGKFVAFTGMRESGKRAIAWELEQAIIERGGQAYYFGISNLFADLDREESDRTLERDQHIEKLGELARVMTDAGLIFITTLEDVDDFDLQRLRELNAPHELLVVNLGESEFENFPIDVQLAHRTDAQSGLKPSSTLNKHNVLDFEI